ncbi:MAG: RagB/SusD family nutrient uptake outer membrane protein [Flavobacterium sp.]|nr:RagB/SusD family nutrient uptake outer membrane protein [Flavobacterium sp.]
MKKVLSYLLIASALFVTSCNEDLTETFASGQLTEDVAITSSNDLRQLLNSGYNILARREAAVFTSVFTDEATKGFNNGGQGVSAEIVFNIFPSSAAPTNIWQNYYFALARINRVIARADVITPVSPEDAQVIARIKAEALILRAYAHLDILAYFSPDMKNNAALAGILSDRVILTSETPLRTTNEAFYTLIHSDLDAALATLSTNTASPPPTTPANGSTFYANSNFARGLKARAYAYKGDYTNAEIWADNVISSSGIALASPAQYRLLFWSDSEAANTEVIFRLRRTIQQNSQDFNLHNGWCSIRPSAGGSPFYEVGRSLHNLLNPQNHFANSVDFNAIPDVRARVIIAPSSVVSQTWETVDDYLNSDRLVLHKHGGVATGNNTAATSATNAFHNDYKIMRISEMYLIKAECRANAGDLAGAATAVDAIRDARFGSNQVAPTYANATAAWKGILDERRLELAFEGFRFIDIKRIGSLAGITGLDRHPRDYDGLNIPGGNPANLPLNSTKWALPIPQSEVNANGAIQQNPGY